ncbi:MAG: NAD-dependent epimerase/dehydratase family protein [Rhizobiales bacterium]|nr:NAD-dependent epimerase/dehydratase family protein [Hyphomicrobiales bacterium]
MTILVTGAAGFIGSHVCQALLDRGDRVVGIDDLNPYYDPALKQARLDRLLPRNGFSFYQGDIAETAAIAAAVKDREITGVVHLAAQAGVRYSLENPRAYVRSNLMGHLEILELCRHLGTVNHLVYASSSSVYGGNEKVPFSESDPVDHPVSLYAVTKKADELMSHAYAHLYGIAQTGLRYFTVYGPWGRPDMAYWIFTKAMLAGEPIKLFNQGEMWRDFTYIDDIVAGTIAALDNPPSAQAGVPHRIYNIGHNQPEHLGHFVDILEDVLGVKAVRQLEPMQPGDVVRTYADITDISRDLGFSPKTSLKEGLSSFADWYRGYFKP